MISAYLETDSVVRDYNDIKSMRIYEWEISFWKMQYLF